MWLDKLRAMKERSGLTTKEIAEMSNIPEPTLEKLFAGATKDPKLATMQQLVHFFGCTLDDLDSGSKKQAAPSDISEEARKVARAYDRISEHGKGAVRAILEYEEKSAAIKAVKEKNADAHTEAARMVEMIVYRNPASAGVPLYAEDDYDRLEFSENEVEPGADFGIRISGDSMEPTIPDGTIVWVRKTPEIDNGQIGVFMINDSAVCKRFHKDETAILLESDNKKYPPIPIKEFDRLGLVGRVLGYK